jgi:hypothetical protein
MLLPSAVAYFMATTSADRLWTSYKYLHVEAETSEPLIASVSRCQKRTTMTLPWPHDKNSIRDFNTYKRLETISIIQIAAPKISMPLLKMNLRALQQANKNS